MNLQSIAHDLRATGLEWAEGAATYLDTYTTCYAVEERAGVIWVLPALADWHSNWDYTPELARAVYNAKRAYPADETRIVRRTVSPTEEVEQ
ncbi:hypothetical protein [uncultured Corynebacterium sp.]|uniref:hypothetical protein n=1 Tax=uncultured Corynebacterium sp. TaxID=159447 RepID=UPI002594C6DF|nr:hypothetical protein [uncultured Corynebacterium sp.]